MIGRPLCTLLNNFSGGRKRSKAHVVRMIWRNAPPIQRISVSILQSKRIRCMMSPSSPITNIRLLKAGVCCVKSYVSKCTHRWVRILGVGTFCRKRNVTTSSETYLPVGTFRNVTFYTTVPWPIRKWQIVIVINFTSPRQRIADSPSVQFLCLRRMCRR